MNERTYTTHVPVDEALQWELQDRTLAQELADFAEEQACKELGSHFRDQEVDATSIGTRDDRFVITFTWTEDAPARA